MARWLLIPLKESSGCGPVVGIAAVVLLFLCPLLFGLTGELIQVQVLGNTTPIAKRGAWPSIFIGAGVWLAIGAAIWAIRIRK